MADFFCQNAFYPSGRSEQVPVVRALIFKYLMEKKKICAGEDELIVGERGLQRKAAPPYPEICVHSLVDREILNTRKPISPRVSEEIGTIFQAE